MKLLFHRLQQEDRGTCQIKPYGCNQQITDYGKRHRSNDPNYSMNKFPGEKTAVEGEPFNQNRLKRLYFLKTGKTKPQGLRMKFWVIQL